MFNINIIWVIIVFILGSATSAISSPCDRPPEHFPEHHRMSCKARGIPPHIKAHLNLTDEQKSAMDKIISEELSQSRALIDELMDKRLELMEWEGADVFDEQIVRTLAGQIAQLEADLTILRLKSRHQRNDLLTDKQKEQLKQTEMPAPHRERKPGSCPPPLFHMGIAPWPR